MKTAQASALIILAGMSAFWAYTIVDSLLREFADSITYIDLGAIFILGLISGLALAAAIALRRERSNAG